MSDERIEGNDTTLSNSSEFIEASDVQGTEKKTPPECISSSLSKSKIDTSKVRLHIEKFRERVNLWTSKKLKQFDDDEGGLRKKFNGDRSAYQDHIESIAREKYKEGRQKILRLTSATLTNQRGTSERNEASKGRMRSERPKVMPPDLLWPFKCLRLGTFESISKGTLKEKEISAAVASSSSATDKIKVASLFANRERELVVDVGSGQGRFLLRYAFEQNRKSNDEKTRYNFLGLEIRKGLVNSSSAFARSLDLCDCCQFLHANVDATFLRTDLAGYRGRTRLICFQLPDPRLEKNLRRGGQKLLTSKRVLSVDVRDAAIELLSPENGMIYISSDYETVFDEMNDILTRSPALRRATSKEIESIRRLTPPSSSIEDNSLDCGNPIGIPTERELFLRQRERDRIIYRAIFIRTKEIRVKKSISGVASNSVEGTKNYIGTE